MRPLKCLVYLTLAQCRAVAFDFTFTAPSQCDDLTVSWSGGQAPFYLLVTPMFDVSINLTIPDDSYNNNTQRGKFTTPLNLAAGTQFLLTMSDAVGLGTGGTSALLTTGSSRLQNPTCNTTQPDPTFLFQLNKALQQCRTYTFSAYNGSVQPVRISGLIPLGQAFELFPSVGPTSFDWITNIAGGTSITFLMTDADGRSGGSSDMKVVGWSDKADCLDASSPRSTVTNPATATPVSLIAQAPPIRPGVIAGAVVGGCVFVTLIVLFSICLIRRDRRVRHQAIVRRRHPEMVFVNNGTSGNPSRVSRVRSSLMPTNRRRIQPSIDLLPPRPTLDGMMSSSTSLPRPSEYEPNPFILPSDGSIATLGHSGEYPRTYSLSRPLSQQLTSSNSTSDDIAYPSVVLPNSRTTHASRRPSLPLTYASGTPSRKASMVGIPIHIPRLVLHTDADDVPTVANEPGTLVELPPQYADRRMTMSPGLEPRNISGHVSNQTPPPPVTP